MAERTEKAAREMVEVRLLAKQINQRLPDGTVVLRKRGDVFQIEKAIWARDLEPDRGMGRPARGRAFALVSEDQAVQQKKEQAFEATQDRIRATRESMRDQLAALEQSRVRAKVQEAENVKKMADALRDQDEEKDPAKVLTEVTKPLERPGARRTG